MKAHIGTYKNSTREKVLNGLPRENNCQIIGNRGLETHHVKVLNSSKAFSKITTQVNICITTCSLLFMACIQAFLGLLINKKFE
jgi:hypothetical protein